MTTDALTGTLFRDGRWDADALGQALYEAEMKAIFAPDPQPWSEVVREARAEYEEIALALAARIAHEPAWVIGAGVLGVLEGASDDAG